MMTLYVGWGANDDCTLVGDANDDTVHWLGMAVMTLHVGWGWQ